MHKTTRIRSNETNSSDGKMNEVSAVCPLCCGRCLTCPRARVPVLSLILSHCCVKYEHGTVLPRARVTGPRLAAKTTREQPPILEENL